MKKIVLKLGLHDDKARSKAMKTVSALPGVDSIGMDANNQNLTVTGDVDPILIAAKLRKFCQAEIFSVGPIKEAEPKKEEPKKQDPLQHMNDVDAYRAYDPQMHPHYYVRGVEENPNACVIC